MATTQLTTTNFESTLADSDIVLVDFWAPWCGPCRAFGPIFEKASQNHDDVVFGKVNTEEEQELAGAMGIRSIPTLMIFRQNVLLFSQPGMLPEEALHDLIEQARKVDMDEVRAEIARRRNQEPSATDVVQ